MNFDEMLIRAKSGEEPALTRILELYRPLLMKASIINGSFDEDLYQEQCIVLLKCIRQFRV